MSVVPQQVRPETRNAEIFPRKYKQNIKQLLISLILLLLSTDGPTSFGYRSLDVYSLTLLTAPFIMTVSEQIWNGFEKNSQNPFEVALHFGFLALSCCLHFELFAKH